MKGSFRPNVFIPIAMFGVLMEGVVESIRRSLVLGLLLIAGTAMKQASSVGPLWGGFDHTH